MVVNELKEYKFKFSIIMAIYNSQDYLKEAIDSVINQSLDFKENVQLILVDDGSTDDSKQICGEYFEQYPNNIFFLSKKHMGIANTRNSGLNYASGKYVNFLDSDDYLSKHALRNVLKFFDENYDKTDVVSIPMFYFDNEGGDHELNYKFKKSRIIDLENCPENIQFSVSSAFIKHDAIKGDFDFDLICSEDVLFLYKILIDKKTLGVLNNAQYYFRKKDKLNDFNEVIQFEKEFYNERLERFHLNLIDFCKSSCGSVPHFVQYMLVYDLKSVISQETLFMCDSREEEDELFDYLRQISGSIDKEVIVNNDCIPEPMKCFFYKMSGEDFRVEFKNKNVLMKNGDLIIDKLRSHKIWLYNVSLNGNILCLTGSFSSFFNPDYLAFEGVKQLKNGEKVAFASSYIDALSGSDKVYLSMPMHYRYHFDLRVPLSEDDSNIMIKLIYHKNADKTDFSDENTISYYLSIDFSAKTSFSAENNALRNDCLGIVFEDNKFNVCRSFKFAVIVAVYNTEEYLHECIGSLINQTIGFEENVQLILVNDGSEDKSEEILLEYQKQYSDNISVISQKNSGQASARNNGLKHVRAKYVNFLDSDDYLEKNALEEVYGFFEEHYDETNVVSIPIQFFEKNNRPHPLNGKYDGEESRVVDLVKEPNNPQLSSSSAFFKTEMVTKFNFPTNVIFSEDVILINKILLEKKTLGLVNRTTYFYRKRFDESSTIDTVSEKKEYFTDKLKDYFLYLFDYAKSKEGEIPKFLQYTLAYDLQWIFHEDISILNPREIEEFWYYLRIVVDCMDIETIVNNRYIRNPFIKNYFLSVKENDFHHEIQDNDVLAKAGNHVCDKIASHRLWLDIVELRDGYLNLSGFFNGLFDNKYLSVEAVKRQGNDVWKFPSRYARYTSRPELKLLSETFQFRYNFDITVPVYANEKSNIRLRVNYHKDGDNTNFSEENIVSSYLLIEFAAHAKLSKLSNYKVNGSNLLYFENNTFYFIPTTLKEIFKKEKANIKAIKEEMGTVDDEHKRKYIKAIRLRRAYLYTYPFFKYIHRNKQVCLFEDRIDIADDNATHLFKYANKVKDKAIKYFVLSKDSKQHGKVSKMGKILNQNSFKHRLMMFHADKVISSHPYESVINPFYSYEDNERFLYAGLLNYKIYFLQHGVTLGNISSWMSKFDKNLSLITTVADLEYNSFLEEGYGYDESIIQKLGFPRFDNLKNNDNKQILIIPSWRKYIRNNKDIFINSDYYNNINSFLNNPELKNIKDKGFKLVFKPHWELTNTIGDSDERYFDLLDIPDYIDVSFDDSYQDLFNNSAIMVTDYSSVFFDFAYLKKPLIHYQPHDDYHYDRGYFDFDVHGFGDVVKSEDELVDKIKWYVENDCRLEDKYVERVDNFFIFNDRNNCKRVYDWIYEH